MQEMPDMLPRPSPSCGGPSLHTLRRLDAGDLRGGELVRVRTHTDDCQDCQAVLRDFVADKAALRTALPFAALEARLEKKPATSLLSGWMRFAAGGAAAIGAAFTLVLLVPHKPGDAEPRVGTQTKGGRTLDFVVKSGTVLRPGQDGDQLRAGDALEFRYNADGLGYVLIFGVDADGKVFPYVMNGDRSATAGKGVTLSPNAVVLDEDPRAERVFAIFSKDPIGVDEVKPAVKDGLATAGGIESMTALPGYSDQATILIRKAVH